MDEFILQLTHDNNRFEEQWTDTFTRIEEASISNDSKLLVLNALVDYVRTESIDPVPADVKYLLVTMVTQQVIKSEVSIEINNLVNNQIILTNTQTIFQQFYKHVIQQSEKSSVWLKIGTTLNESSPEIFDNNISSDFLKQYKDNKELLKTNFIQLLTILEDFIEDEGEFIR